MCLIMTSGYTLQIKRDKLTSKTLHFKESSASPRRPSFGTAGKVASQPTPAAGELESRLRPRLPLIKLQENALGLNLSIRKYRSKDLASCSGVGRRRARLALQAKWAPAPLRGNIEIV